MHDPVDRRQLEQRDQRVSDVVHGHDVRHAVRVDGNLVEQPARERAQRPVDHVEDGRPAGPAVADDDRGARHDERQPVRGGGQRAFAFELRLLVGVAKALADVEVALGEHALVAPRDVSGRDVHVAAQAAELRELAAQLEHAQRPARVDLVRLVLW